jgi:hypothetical protein
MKLESATTITNSAWLFFQWLHLWSYPKFGQASAFWDPHRARRKLSRIAYAAGLLLYKAKLLHLITRLADGLGIGDNLVCTLRKPD